MKGVTELNELANKFAYLTNEEINVKSFESAKGIVLFQDYVVIDRKTFENMSENLTVLHNQIKDLSLEMNDLQNQKLGFSDFVRKFYDAVRRSKKLLCFASEDVV